MSQQRWVDILGNTPLFANWSETERTTVVRLGQIRQFAPDHVVLDIEEPGHGLYVLLEGTCRVCIPNEQRPSPDVIARLQAPTVFGELSFVDRQPTVAQVQAETPVVVLFLPRDTFGTFLRQHPEIERRFLWSLAELLAMRIRLTDQQLLLARELMIRSMRMLALASLGTREQP